MSQNSQIPSLEGEADELNDTDLVILEIFKHCDNMKTDILEYSSDVKTDLKKFKNLMVDLSEVQKNIRGLECAIKRLNSTDSGAEPAQILKAFDRIHRSAMEDQYIADEVENLITAVDSYINRDSEDVDLDDSELIVTSTTDSYKDPITKQTLKDPVKSIICNHTYERSIILRYLQKHSRCPCSGCSAIFRREDLVDDLETKRKLLNMTH